MHCEAHASRSVLFIFDNDGAVIVRWVLHLELFSRLQPGDNLVINFSEFGDEFVSSRNIDFQVEAGSFGVFFGTAVNPCSEGRAKCLRGRPRLEYEGLAVIRNSTRRFTKGKLEACGLEREGSIARLCHSD